MLVVWLLAGLPPWAPAVAVGVALLARILRIPFGGELAAVVILVLLIPALSVWAWSLLIAGGMVVVATRPPAAIEVLQASRVRKSLVSAAALLALVALGGLIVDHMADARERDAERAAAAEYARSQMLPRSPVGTARVLLYAIAEDEPSVACDLVLTSVAADQLATSVGVDSCPAAISAMRAKVRDLAEYVSPDYGTIEQRPGPAGAVIVDACGLTWDGLAGLLNGQARPAVGPQLGMLEVRRDQHGSGHRIVGYMPCP